VIQLNEERLEPTIGWDLGGIHLKAALCRGGVVCDVVQVPCLLWRGLDALDESFAALPEWAHRNARHAVTMTGELCDYFTSRREGVAALVRWAVEHLEGRLRVYGGRAGFLSPDEADAAASDVASANWHATAALVGRHLPAALLVDIGSTTTDLIPIVSGRPEARGYMDFERLATGELVYSGAVRTPLMALAERVLFRGRQVGLMAEHFATTADVHRLLEDLPAEADQQEAADGRGKSIPETETRLARMIGCDRTDASSADWRQLASALAEAQLRRLQDSARQVLSATEIPGQAPVVGCGVGRFIATRLAERLDRGFVDLAELIAPDAKAGWVSSCAPAVAVALLAAEE
jgi:probable H4MPT-linked C1 transfer pathway protein